MRIAISGTANTGKTTLINDFLTRWPSYTSPQVSYRSIVEKYKDQHSSNTNEDVQEEILNFMISSQEKYTADDNVILDRCTLDNLAYTLWGVHKDKISSKYADSIIPKIRESLKNIDIIFIIRHDPTIQIVEDGVRDTNIEYIREIDAIFGLIVEDYLKFDDNTFTLFPKDDMPAVIEIGGTPNQRLAQIADYVDPFGKLIETDPSESVLSPSQIEEMEKLVKLQERISLEEKWSI